MSNEIEPFQPAPDKRLVLTVDGSTPEFDQALYRFLHEQAGLGHMRAYELERANKYPFSDDEEASTDDA